MTKARNYMYEGKLSNLPNCSVKFTHQVSAAKLELLLPVIDSHVEGLVLVAYIYLTLLSQDKYF